MITNVGSINVDYIVTSPRMPILGETLLGHSVKVMTGGKGANQIAAAARLGAKTCFITMVGAHDGNLSILKGDLKWANVGMDCVIETEDAACGCAFVMINDAGQNSIIIIHGADVMLTPEVIQSKKAYIEKSRICMTEFMIPMETCEYSMKLAKENGVFTLVNPAPVASIDDSFYKYMDLITPNEVEAAQYCGFPVDDEKSVRAACEFFYGKGVKNVVITLGSRGAYAFDGKQGMMIDSHKVNAIDTNGAGDAFNGGLAYALWKGHDLFTAARFANGVSSISVQRHGALHSAPTLDEAMSAYRLEDRV